MIAIPFEAFLRSHVDGWTMRIEMTPHLSQLAHTAEEAMQLLHNRGRGTFSVLLRINTVEQGRATLSKVLSGKLKTDMASGECIGLAMFYNAWLLSKEEVTRP